MNVAFLLHFRIYKWDETKFVFAIERDDFSRHKSFMDDLGKKLNIKDPSGWYNLTTTTLKKQGASSLLGPYNGSPRKLLQSLYPQYHEQVVCCDQKLSVNG